MQGQHGAQPGPQRVQRHLHVVRRASTHATDCTMPLPLMSTSTIMIRAQENMAAAKKKRKEIAPERLVETETDQFNNPVAPDLFCGECGARSSPDGGEFCNECGAPFKDFVVDRGSSGGSMEVEI